MLQGAGHARYVPNGRSREVNKGTTTSSVPTNSDGTEGLEMLSSRLAAASPAQQKQMLGDRLFPLVNQLKVLLLYYIHSSNEKTVGDLGETCSKTNLNTTRLRL